MVSRHVGPSAREAGRGGLSPTHVQLHSLGSGANYGAFAEVYRKCGHAPLDRIRGRRQPGPLPALLRPRYMRINMRRLLFMRDMSGSDARTRVAQSRSFGFSSVDGEPLGRNRLQFGKSCSGI